GHPHWSVPELAFACLVPTDIRAVRQQATAWPPAWHGPCPHKWDDNAVPSDERQRQRTCCGRTVLPGRSRRAEGHDRRLPPRCAGAGLPPKALVVPHGGYLYSG